MRNLIDTSNSIAVIIPAYNESQNLPILIKNIYRFLPLAKIIIVDDSSITENHILRRRVNKINKKIEVISRQARLGRGSAVLMGFKRGLEDQKTKFFFEMDADLSHNPAELKLFLDKKNQADLIVGSRYLSKSRIVKWSRWRLLQSKTINLCLNYWLGLSLTDYTNGFRLYSRTTVEYLTSIALRETGFIALSEMAYHLKKKSFKIMEVPISFTDRIKGKSNANAKELLKSLVGAFKIRFIY